MIFLTRKNVSVLLSKSPESATTVVNFFNCSRVEAMIPRSLQRAHCKLTVLQSVRPAGSPTRSNFDQRFSSKRKKQDGGRSELDKCGGNRRRKGLIYLMCLALNLAIMKAIISIVFSHRNSIFKPACCYLFS